MNTWGGFEILEEKLFIEKSQESIQGSQTKGDALRINLIRRKKQKQKRHPPANKGV
ncbi:MAG: hypothetical protein K2P90_03780 [Holosporales bacterium]|jgi:hypothetical protein|nr:hypothetical protein [Holosporales bacterium]